MKRRYHSLILISFILATIISCGGSGGAPGSDFGDTGIMIKSAILSVESPDIDTRQNCCSFDTATGLCTEVEIFTREDATLSVETVNLTPAVTSDHFPARIQECTITYLKANEDPASPIIETLTVRPSCTLAEGTNECPMTIIDIDRKLQYSIPVFETGMSIPEEQPTHYVGRASCTYTNNFGESGRFEATIDIWLSDFDNC